MKADWIARVQVPGKLDMWVGNFQADGRTDAKRAARRFVSEHLPLDTTILNLALGRVDIHFAGPSMPFEDGQ